MSSAAEVNDDGNPKTAGIFVPDADCEIDPDVGCSAPLEPIAWGPSSSIVLPVLSTSSPMKDAALAVNNSVDGEYDVVGFSTYAPGCTAPDCRARALVWHVDGSGNVTVFDLHEDAVPALVCTDSGWAHGANNRDEQGRMQIVGRSALDGAMRWSRDPSTCHLWTKVRLIDLVCGAEAAGWSLNWGYTVSDNGYIVGLGHPPGESYHAFLLIPVDDPCPADLNCDGDVDGQDLAILLGAWGSCPEDDLCPADLNNDCKVDGLDLAILLGEWGECGSSSFTSSSPSLQTLIEILEAAGYHALAQLLQSVWPQE